MNAIAWTAATIAERLTDGDVVYLCADDQQGNALASAVAAMTPNAAVLFVPSSDALPGDQAPASPSNVGRRVAALRRLRQLQTDAARPPIACILSGEAAARRYPPPQAFDGAPPCLAVGDTIDRTALAGALAAIGYIDDDGSTSRARSRRAAT